MKRFLTQKTVISILCTTFLILLISCSTISGIDQEPLTAGDEKVYSVPAEKVKSCVSIAATSSGYSLAGQKTIDNSTYCYMLDKPASMSSWGQVARVIVISKDAKTTIVRFFNKKKNAMNVTEDLDSSKKIFFLNLDSLAR